MAANKKTKDTKYLEGLEIPPFKGQRISSNQTSSHPYNTRFQASRFGPNASVSSRQSCHSSTPAAPFPSSPPLTLQNLREEMKGAALKDFQLDKVIGTGTFGKVFSAVHSPTNTRVAFKVLHKRQVVRTKQVEHVFNEKKILSQCHHPFIVSLFSSFQDTANLYIVMEFVSGGELFSLIRNNFILPPPTAIFYAAEITLALEYLHSHSIVYRDLKPENVLIQHDGHLKLTDFGFAKQVEDLTYTLCGTPEYLAPEIIQSSGHGLGVDWWALGIIVYEMLAGYPPFYDNHPLAIYEKILLGFYSFPSHFTEPSKSFIRCLLVRDTTKRLGCLRQGASDIKNHIFFSPIDWHQLSLLKVFAVYVRTLSLTKSLTGYAAMDSRA